MGPGKRNGSSTSKAEPRKGGLWSELERYLVYGLVALDLGFSKGVAGMDRRAFISRGCSDWLVPMSHGLLKMFNIILLSLRYSAFLD